MRRRPDWYFIAFWTLAIVACVAFWMVCILVTAELWGRFA